jgi:hypothetical protein
MAAREEIAEGCRVRAGTRGIGKAQKDEISLPESMAKQNASNWRRLDRCTLQRQLKRKKRFSKKNII